MGTPMAFTSGTTNGFSLGATKRATIALNPATSLVAGNNWFNGVDVSTQYLIYSDTFSQGQAPITTARPTAWTTPNLTDASLLALINTLPDRVGQTPYTDINVALQWLQNSEKYFLIKNGYEDIVTDGLVLNLDAGWYNSYPGNTSSIASSWTDYNNKQAYYTPISNNGVILYSTFSDWVGYFPATVNSAGLYTLEFDYVTNDAGTLVLDNDGIVDNEWNASIANTTTQQKYKVTRYIGTTGNINFFLRRSNGGNHTITNFSFTNANTWFDLSGQGNNGTLFNSPTFSSNGQGSLNFDGTDDYVRVNESASIDITTNTITFGAWCYPTVSNKYQHILVKGVGESRQYGMWLSVDGTSKIFRNVNGVVTQTDVTISTPWVVNAWNYIMLVYNGSTIKIYLNGLEVFSENASGNITHTNSNVNLGGEPTQPYLFVGNITNGQIYNRALTADEIFQNYNAQKARFGLGGQSLFSGATQYLDFSKQSSYPGTGTNLNDVSGNGFNDTITNPEQVKYIDGVKCLDCSTGAQINGDTSNSPTLGNNYTIFTWARVISSTAEWRTLLRTFDDDHPLLVESGGNTIGYYDNNGGGFIASSLSVSTLGLADRWVLYTIVGSSGTQQTFYINQGTSNSTVSANATGEKMDDICNHSGQIFGPVGSCVVYNNQSFTQAQVAQYFNATKQYYGYTPDNVYGNGLSMYYNAGNPISYPGTGTTLYNLVGIGSNMVLYNGPTFNSSYGGVIQMDATDDYARVTSPNIILGTNPRTAILWFYATTSQYGCIYGFGNSPNGTPTYGSMELWNYADPLSLHYAGGSISSGLNLSTNTNKWLMCALRFDGTNASIRIIDNGTVYSNSAAVPLNTYSANYSINKSAYANEGGGMGGYIGISATYIRSLSDGEVTNFYNETKSRYGL